MKNRQPGLHVRWSKRERDLLFGWDAMSGGSSNAGMLAYAMTNADAGHGKSLAAELEARGFDLTTLRFSIQLKPPAAKPERPVDHAREP